MYINSWCRPLYQTIMGVMHRLSVVVVLIGLVGKVLAVGCKPQYLTVRTPRYDTEPQPSFLDVPKWCGDKNFEFYEKVCLEDGFEYYMDLYCIRNDPRFCLFFDKNGCLAGAQTSYIKADIEYVDPNVYNYSNPNYIDTCFYDQPAKSVRLYFTHPEKLTKHGRHNCTCTEIIEGLWVKLDGKLVRFDSKVQPNSPAIGDYARQGCSPRIGTLYIKGMHETDSCTNGFFLYLLYSKGDLIGFGHGAPGVVSKSPTLDVHDHPRGPKVETLFPNAPPCFWDLNKFGWTVLGMYTAEEPWNTRCPSCNCH